MIHILWIRDPIINFGSAIHIVQRLRSDQGCRHHGWIERLALARAKRFVEEGAYDFITGLRQEALDEPSAY